MKLSKTTQKQLIKVDYKIFKEKIFSLFFNNLVHKVLVYYEQMNYQIQPKYFYKKRGKVLTSTIHIYCDVIDNFGDAGFCLRLSRDLSRFFKTNLFCNNLEILKKITNKEDLSSENLQISSWPTPTDNYEVPDVVIEAFSCRLPEYILEKLRKIPPLIIELEYLTAENFADDCHTLSSFADGLSSYFFFPGFTKQTGGVIFEKEFINKATQIQSSTVDSDKKKISLFSYPQANLKALIHSLFNSKYQFEITLFEGLPLKAVNSQFNLNLEVGDKYQLKNIEFIVKKMVSQEEYDSLICKSDLNLVRGEESIVRAMLCGKPFLWNIYPQEEYAHKIKLEAFFDRMYEFCEDKKTAQKLKNLNLSYNNFADDLYELDFDKFYDDWMSICQNWTKYLQSLGSLTDNLKSFIESKLKK